MGGGRGGSKRGAVVKDGRRVKEGLCKGWKESKRGCVKDGRRVKGAV